MFALASRIATGVFSAGVPYFHLAAGGGGSGGGVSLFKRRSASGRKLPGRWIDSDCDGEDEDRDGDWWDDGSDIVRADTEREVRGKGGGDSGDGETDGEDDYGVPLGNDTPARKRRARWGGGGGPDQALAE